MTRVRVDSDFFGLIFFGHERFIYTQVDTVDAN